MSKTLRCECRHPAGLHVWNGCQSVIDGRAGSRQCPCELTSRELHERAAISPERPLAAMFERSEIRPKPAVSV